MKKELADRFNRQVDGYRKALVYYARSCDWDAFKTKAGNLFDYLESVELSELERRFFGVFKPVLFILIIVVFSLFEMNTWTRPELQQLRNAVIFTAIAGSCFETYFFLGYRKYVGIKSQFLKKRREAFIIGIEQDFKTMTSEPKPGTD